MSTHRVIQDSDESDNEIVPIVAPVTTLQGPSPNASVSMQVDDPTINTPLNFASTIPSEGAASLGLGLPVNFDEFLDSSGSRRESVDSLGNRQVCGEGGEKLNDQHDVVLDHLSEEKAVGHAATSPKAIVKRGRKINVLEGLNSPATENTKLKRRKTMPLGNDYQTQPADLTDFLYEGSGHPNYGKSPGKAASSIAPNNVSYQTADFVDSSLQPDHSTDTNQIAVHDHIRPPGARWQSQSNKTGRSKSMFLPTDSPHDTEPMSSTSLARARRTLTSHEEKPPASSADSVDELALPASVQIAMSNTRRIRKQPSVQNYDGQSNEQDELSSDDFGGMPKEMYKPRPSRSRVKKVEEEDIHDMSHDFENAESHLQGRMSLTPLLGADNLVDEIITVPKLNQISDDSTASLPVSENALTSAADTTAYADAAPPSAETPKKSSKSSKKKKVKRGKTMSVIIKKTAETDVEDDVIWIDERPLPLPEKEQIFGVLNVIPSEEGVLLHDNRAQEVDNTTVTTVVETIEANTNNDEIPVSALKKRVKRSSKKTDILAVEIPAKLSRPHTHKVTNETEMLDDAPVPEPPGEPHDTAPPRPHPASNAMMAPDDTICIEDLQTTPQQDEVQGYSENKCSTPTKTYVTAKGNRDALVTTNEAQSSSTPNQRTERGPDKHSPIAVNKKMTYRVGLSRKTRIAPLLKVIRK